MTIKLRWDDDDQAVMRLDIEAHWTWGEMRKARKIAFDMMDQSPAPRIYTLIYFVEGKLNMPPGMWDNWDAMTKDSHPRAGLTVMVGASGWMKTTFSTLGSTFRMTGRPLDFAYADSLEHARQIIAREQARIRG